MVLFNLLFQSFRVIKLVLIVADDPCVVDRREDILSSWLILRILTYFTPNFDNLVEKGFAFQRKTLINGLGHTSGKKENPTVAWELAIHRGISQCIQ